MFFYIDGVEVGQFMISSAGGAQTAVDANGPLVYANNTLPLGNHTLRIQNGPSTNESTSLMMLDKIVYT